MVDFYLIHKLANSIIMIGTLLYRNVQNMGFRIVKLQSLMCATNKEIDFWLKGHSTIDTEHSSV